MAITSGSSGTALGTTNNLYRCQYGSNNWLESAVRQYLNSSANAGSVWTPQNNYDRPPSWATTTAGFLNGLDSDFQAVLTNVNKVTSLNTITDGGGSATNKELIFLLARGEVNGNNENSIDEGTPYQYFTQNRGDTGTGRNDSADSNRIKYNASGVAVVWDMRSPYTGTAHSIRYINNLGGSGSGGATNLNYIVPACVIA